jgi:hypothetical protein
MELSLPAVQALGPEAPVVDPISCSDAYSDHSAVLDGDVEPATIAAQQTGRSYPGIDVAGGQPIYQTQVTSLRPRLPRRVRRPRAPDVVDA